MILEFFVDKFMFVEVVEDFLVFIDGVELIIYNVVFDLGFLDNELLLLGD